MLKPVFVCDDPIRGEPHKLVMCEVFLVSGEPHPSNTRAACREIAENYAHHDTWFGLEQEYTFFDGIKPLGWPDNGFPAPQGGYYCGVGADEVFGRPVVEAHLENCLKAGLKISGINAEVMPGQWEFQVGPVAAPEVADQLWVARWLLYRTAEDFPTTVGQQRLGQARPEAGQGRLERRRLPHQLLDRRDARELRRVHRRRRGARHAPRAAHRQLRRRHRGAPDRPARDGLAARVHATASRTAAPRCAFRGRSRIDKKGYIEDRRPNANMDPYVVTRLIIETVCGTADGRVERQRRGRRKGGGRPLARAAHRLVREFVDRHPPVDAVLLGRIVAGGQVVRAAVVPDDDVADAPLVAVLGVRLDHALGELVDDRVALGWLQALDAQDLARIEVQRLAPGLGMRADDRMQDRLPVAIRLVQQRRRLAAGRRR